MTEVLAGSVADTARRCEQILAGVERVIVGKRQAVTMVLLGVLASGHILIEDLPGLGKTPPGPDVRRRARAKVHPRPVHPGHASRGPDRGDSPGSAHG
jgi:MoxR-like ATPase